MDPENIHANFSAILYLVLDDRTRSLVVKSNSKWYVKHRSTLNDLIHIEHLKMINRSQPWIDFSFSWTDWCRFRNHLVHFCWLVLLSVKIAFLPIERTTYKATRSKTKTLSIKEESIRQTHWFFILNEIWNRSSGVVKLCSRRNRVFLDSEIQGDNHGHHGYVISWHASHKVCRLDKIKSARRFHRKISMF